MRGQHSLRFTQSSGLYLRSWLWEHGSLRFLSFAIGRKASFGLITSSIHELSPCNKQHEGCPDGSSLNSIYLYKTTPALSDLCTAAGFSYMQGNSKPDRAA